MTDPDHPDFPRLLAPVYFTRAGSFPRLFRNRSPPGDSLGGIRVFTDEEPESGVPLRLEIFLVDGTSVTCRATVDWVEELPDGSPARFDVGLRFEAIRPGDRERLSPMLAAQQR